MWSGVGSCQGVSRQPSFPGVAPAGLQQGLITSQAGELRSPPLKQVFPDRVFANRHPDRLDSSTQELQGKLWRFPCG